MGLINGVYQRLGANCNNRWEFNLALMIRRIASESAVTHIRNSHDSYFRSNITCGTFTRAWRTCNKLYQYGKFTGEMCVFGRRLFLSYLLFLYLIWKLTWVFDVNIMLHPVRVKHLNFATKPLSLVATFLYFSEKVTFYGLSCSCSRNSSYLHSGRPSRRATVQFSSQGMWRRSRSRLRHKEKILS